MKYEVKFPNPFTGSFANVDFVQGKAIVEEDIVHNFTAIHQVEVTPILEKTLEEVKEVKEVVKKSPKKKVK